jgi:quercetin dioxygenase-like cupin family protein
MTSITRALVVMALVGTFLLAWGAEMNVDVAVAQTPRTIGVTRLYTGPDGQSHAEEIQLPITNGNATSLMDATGVQFSRTPPGNFSDWHVGPRRQLVITLAGRGEIEVTGGKKIAIEPGHINLVEDLTGKGHTTRVVGNQDRITVAIRLTDQNVRIGATR